MHRQNGPDLPQAAQGAEHSGVLHGSRVGVDSQQHGHAEGPPVPGRPEGTGARDAVVQVSYIVHIYMIHGEFKRKINIYKYNSECNRREKKITGKITIVYIGIYIHST